MRISEMILEYEILLSTDDFLSRVIPSEEFQLVMSTAEFHFRPDSYAREREKLLGLQHASFLSSAF